MFEKFKNHWSQYVTRKSIKFASTAMWLLLVVILGTVFRQNIEELSAKYGFNNFLKSGFEMITALGFSTYSVWAFWFITGVSGTLWIDSFLKSKTNAKKLIEDREKLALVSPKRLSGRVFFSLANGKTYYDDTVVSASITDLDSNDISRFDDYGKDTKLLEIEFAQPIEDVAVIMIGERVGVHWQLKKIGKTYIHVKVQGKLDKYELAIEFAEKAQENERFKSPTGNY
jgi:hypothetical protein